MRNKLWASFYFEMGDASLSFEKFNFGGAEDKLSSTGKSSESGKGRNGKKQMQSYGAEGWGELADIYSLCSDYGLCRNDPSEEGLVFSQHQQEEQLRESFLDYGLFGDPSYDILSPPDQTCMEKIAKLDEIQNGIQDVVELRKEKQIPFLYPHLGC